MSLLNVLSAITSVSLLTGNVPPDSPLRTEYEVIEVSSKGTGTNIVVAAIRFVRNQIRMSNKLRKRDEEIVLFFGPTSYLLPILVAKLSGKTVVLQPRGDVPLTLRIHWEERVPSLVARVLAGSVWLLERIGYRLADAIVTYTPSMAEELDLGVFDSKLYTNGARYVDTERFAPTTPFEERDDVVGFLGRLDEEKGIRTLAHVAKQLPQDMRFRFLGDGQLYHWLESELSDERAVGQVELAGWVDHEDVPDELMELRLLVMPSHPTEGLPTAILEAMACGTPAYATPVAGVPDVVREDETGFLMDEGTSDTITSELRDILEREDLAEISANARGLIEEEYSFDAAVERYSMILNRLSEK